VAAEGANSLDSTKAHDIIRTSKYGYHKLLAAFKFFMENLVLKPGFC
jgi:hypothetical protein